MRGVALNAHIFSQGVNASDFALGASVFTTDYAKADRIARGISSGMVAINEWGISALVSSLPFGGSKLRYGFFFFSTIRFLQTPIDIKMALSSVCSGFGRFAGPEGLRDFCHQQAIVTDRLPLRTPQPTWLSYPLPVYAPDVMKVSNQRRSNWSTQ